MLKLYKIWLDMMSVAYRKGHQPKCVLISETLHDIKIRLRLIPKKVILFHKKAVHLMGTFLELQISEGLVLRNIGHAPSLICRYSCETTFVIGFSEMLRLA